MKRKIVLVSLGSKGDVLPFVGVAKVLSQRGFAPIILSCEPYREMVEREGIQFESIMSAVEFNGLLSSPLFWRPLRGLQFYLQRFTLATAQTVFTAVSRHAELGAVAVVTNHMLAGSFIAAEKYSLPIVSVFLQPYAHISSDDPAKVSPLVDRVMNFVGATGRRLIQRLSVMRMQAQLTPLNRMRADLGLKPWRSFMTETRYSADLVLGLWPDWFCPKKSDWPSVCQTTGFVDCSFAEKPVTSAIAQEFLHEQPLVFAMGSEMTQHFEHTVRVMSEACCILGKKGVFVTPVIRGQGTRKVDESLLLMESAPFAEIFPQASCVVTHGGIGTVAIALASGRPIVTIPLGYDQFDNAHHLEQLRAGVTLAHAKLSVDSLIDAVMKAYANYSPVLARRMKRERGAETAALLIERYLQSKRHYVEGESHRLSI